MTKRSGHLLKDLIGTRTERLLDAIVADDIHTWAGLKTATGFSEKELNFHLAKLYSLELLTRRGSHYNLVPEAVESYDRIDWRKVDKKRRDYGPRLAYRLPSLNPKEAGAKKKKLRGE